MANFVADPPFRFEKVSENEYLQRFGEEMPLNFSEDWLYAVERGSDGKLMVLKNVFVSTLGRVKNGKGEVWWPNPHPDGYVRIGVTLDDARSFFLLHRMVWQAYHNRLIPEDQTIDHHNYQNKWDNRIENLRLATSSEQRLNRDPNAKSHGPAQERRVESRLIGSDEWVGHSGLMVAAREVCGSHCGISNCLAGRRKTHAGREWRYGDDPDLPGEVWRRLQCYTGGRELFEAPEEGYRVSNKGRYATPKANKREFEGDKANFIIRGKHLLLRRAIATTFCSDGWEDVLNDMNAIWYVRCYEGCQGSYKSDELFWTRDHMEKRTKNANSPKYYPKK